MPYKLAVQHNMMNFGLRPERKLIVHLSWTKTQSPLHWFSKTGIDSQEDGAKNSVWFHFSDNLFCPYFLFIYTSKMNHEIPIRISTYKHHHKHKKLIKSIWKHKNNTIIKRCSVRDFLTFPGGRRQGKETRNRLQEGNHG